MTAHAANDQNFDASIEPMRAIRDLISACEGVFGADCGDDDILRRAQDGFTALRKLFGDNRPGEEIAFARMAEPGTAAELLATLQLTSGALQCVATLLPAGERHVVKFTGDYQCFGCWSVRSNRTADKSSSIAAFASAISART